MNAAVASEIHVTVNGSARRLACGTTVTALLAQLDATGRRVAVERNGTIVPRSAHAQTRLADGDLVEVVIAVGGG